VSETEHKLPAELLESLHGIEGFDKQAFTRVHESGGKVVSIRLNPSKAGENVFPDSEKVPWNSYGYYLPSRPSFILDPLLHAGAYYVQEASSMFIEQCIRQHAELSQSLTVLDLCAAPGGKSTLIQSVIGNTSLLVSNEVIKSRASVLVENLSKWGGANVVVTNNDPKDFARLENFFDVMVIDAPCSGSGLFRRDPDAIEEWSEDLVDMCSHRQKRILADAYTSLKKGGLLIYSTCSYSKEEDEEIADWLMESFSLESLSINTEKEWNIVETTSDHRRAKGYRFFPDRLKGEGLFVACFRKLDGEDEFHRLRKSKLVPLSKKETTIVDAWLDGRQDLSLYAANNEIFAFPSQLSEELEAVQSALYIKKAGVLIGKLVRDELIPAHELAVSTVVNKNLLKISLNRRDALQYLRKEEVTIDSGEKGWALVEYKGQHLGWIKLLGNRVNNYYPKEWRILKSENN
jgi:16S rRNA C967 or C1407 C5-methylase (RsmB/RsmF family)/NOL1/NOP2/fmu family ribosome biogenesis protein